MPKQNTIITSPPPGNLEDKKLWKDFVQNGNLNSFKKLLDKNQTGYVFIWSGLFEPSNELLQAVDMISEHFCFFAEKQRAKKLDPDLEFPRAYLKKSFRNACLTEMKQRKDLVRLELIIHQLDANKESSKTDQPSSEEVLDLLMWAADQIPNALQRDYLLTWFRNIHWDPKPGDIINLLREKEEYAQLERHRFDTAKKRGIAALMQVLVNSQRGRDFLDNPYT